MTIFQQSLVKRSTGSAASTTNPSRGSQRVSISWSSTRSESSVHGFEEGCVALRRFPQLAEQEFDSIDRAHWIENTPQHIHFLQDVRGHQQFLLAGAGARDVDCGVSPFVGALAVENDFRIAGALEFLEDHFVHARAGIDKRSRDDRQRAALLDIARGAQEWLTALQGIGVDAAGQNLARRWHDRVISAAKSRNGVEEDHHVAAMLDETLGLLNDHFGDLDMADRGLVERRGHHLAAD